MHLFVLWETGVCCPQARAPKATSNPHTHLVVARVHAPQIVVAESYGGSDEPVDTLTASLVGVGAEVSRGSAAPAHSGL